MLSFCGCSTSTEQVARLSRLCPPTELWWIACPGPTVSRHKEWHNSAGTRSAWLFLPLGSKTFMPCAGRGAGSDPGAR